MRPGITFIPVMTKKIVRDLCPGDDLGNCVIVSNHHIGTVRGVRYRHEVKVRYPSGKEVVTIWGRWTTVQIKNKAI